MSEDLVHRKKVLDSGVRTCQDDIALQPVQEKKKKKDYNCDQQ